MTTHKRKNKMRDENKTKKQLIDELIELRKRVSKLEKSENKYKKTEKALREAHQLLETVYDHTHMMVAYLDPQFNFIRVNRAYARADEREPSFFPGKNHFDLYPNAENEAIFRRVVETGQPHFSFAKSFEYAEHLNRGVSYWDWSLIPIKDENGSVIGLILTLLNVTERKKVEERIIHLTRLYAVLSKINEAIVRADKPEELYRQACRIIVEDGLFRMAWIGIVNPDTLLVEPVAIYGYEEGYLKERMISVDEKIPEGKGPTGTAIREKGYFICNDIENDPIMTPWREAALKRGYHSSAAFALKSGTHIIGSINIYSSEAYFFKEEAVVVKLLTALADDVSFAIESMENEKKRKKAEKALQKIQHEQRAILDNIPDIAWLKDEESRFIAVNEPFGKACGVKPEDLVGRTDLDIWPRELAERYRSDDKEVMQSGRRKQVEEPLVDKEGKTTWIETIKTPIYNEKGEVIGTAGIARDITERKKLEAQLLHAQKMEAVGQLTGGIAHDFNNILQAIMSIGGLLQFKTKEGDPLRECVNDLFAVAERATNLTKSLLAFSRKQIISLMPVNLNDIIKNAEKILSRVMGEDIELKINLSDKDLPLMADLGQIEQVLMNLTTNARDAMPAGGILTIETELVGMDDEYIKMHGYGKPGKYALISVSDTGAGMDEKTREKIFEPFFTTKEIGKGTGLGLSIVYGIVKQHGGYINVYSELGKGTTFKIYLPLIESVAEQIKPSVAVAVTGGSETVLLAEDDASVRRLTKAALEEFGYKIIEAEDGEDAINKFMENKDRIQLFLLDAVMPKKSGKAAYEEIKKIKPDIKALFMSGYSTDILSMKRIVGGELNFIVKPVSPTELLKKIREVLDK
jgi:PAS domain S-box-containing protein